MTSADSSLKGEIGSEDSSEVVEGVELSSSSTAATTSSPASCPRRSPRLAAKRSRILQKEGVTSRSRRTTGPPVKGKTLNTC
ncbi:hypothetical protein CDAR_7441 [Caerostris darwini]|uniref:Uncharacterized protein n=1 Tax=Caerostris darwini TaxID=1538125 RepID=A0AAV4RT85_9ARAC|nr:hypothetical protein CDAR_7441 [Caerostris darwini]